MNVINKNLIKIMLLTSLKRRNMLKNGAENSMVVNADTCLSLFSYGITPIHRGWEECPRLLAQKLSAGTIIPVFNPRSTFLRNLSKSAPKRLLNRRLMLRSIVCYFLRTSMVMGV